LHKILLLAQRDYLASIRTKAFLFGLIFAPLMFGGAFLVLALARGNMNVDRHVAILDRTGSVAPAIIQVAEERNQRDMYDKFTGRRAMPRYRFEIIQPDPSGLEAQRLSLSDRVRRHELYAFLEIGPEALDASAASRAASVGYYSDAGLDEFEEWIAGPVNTGLQRARLAQLGVASDRAAQAITSISLESRGLTVRDPQTGGVREPGKKDRAASFGVPYAATLLLMMIVLMGSATMLPAVAEDKLQRVFEMLLVSATPFQLMMGKVLAAVGRSLTGSFFYIAGAFLALQSLALTGLVPVELIPWFLIYVVAQVAMISALGIALGAACGSPQDAQSLNQVLVLPIVIPAFLMAPILQQPNGALAHVFSLFPPFTPMLMLLRQAMPGGVPVWQPWAGLIGILIFGLAATWAASRIFRVAILFQGAAPKLPELLRWAARG
jgi:ABC-2 type transport system permease protein